MLKDKVRSRAILLSLIALLSFLGCEKMGKESPTAAETTLENQSSLPASLSSTPNSIVNTTSAFPGANGKIAFISYRDGNFEIYVMNADGSEQTRLTNNPATDSRAAWSSDGSKIAFISDRDGNFEIYVMNADGSNVTRLTNNSADEGQPAWSPDGTKIAFVSVRDGNPEVYVMNSDGSGQTNLSNNAAGDNYPVLSPDGTKIAFASSRDGNEEIYVMNADGTNQTQLTNNPALETEPTWSPDGTMIAFFSDRDGNAEIYTMNADGSGQTNRTNNPLYDEQPAWSPDGTSIVFDRDLGGNGEIYVMNVDGSGQTNLTNNPATDFIPNWQPLPTPTTTTLNFYLHGMGATGNPSTLFLDNTGPTAATAKYKDSSSLSFSGGNPWKVVGIWTADPALSAGTLITLSDLHTWLGLKNSDDQGTNFDLRAEVYTNGTLVASGETHCITGVTRNPALAKEVVTAFGSFSPTSFNGTTDVLSLKVLTRIGTNGADGFCGGHSNAVGLRLYFDAVSRPSKFDATF